MLLLSDSTWPQLSLKMLGHVKFGGHKSFRVSIEWPGHREPLSAQLLALDLALHCVKGLISINRNLPFSNTAIGELGQVSGMTPITEKVHRRAKFITDERIESRTFWAPAHLAISRNEQAGNPATTLQSPQETE